MENDQVQPIQPTTTPVPPVVAPAITPVQPKSSQLPIVLLSLLSLTFLSGMVYFYIQTQSLKQVANPPTPTTSPSTQTPNPVLESTTPSPTPTDNTTSGQQTYTNTKYGFTFKYPASLSSNEGVVGGPYTGTPIAIKTFSDPATLREGTDAPFDGFTLYVITDTKANNFKEYMEKELLAAQNNPYGDGKNITVNHGFAGSSIAINSNITQHYRPSSDEKTIIVFSEIKSSDQNNFAKSFDQILSTFKFTE